MAERQSKRKTQEEKTEISGRIGEAFQHIRKSTEYVTQTMVAEKMAESRSNLSSAINGNPKYATEGLALKLSKAFPQINFNWLLTGEGEMVDKRKSHLHNEVIQVPEDDYMEVEYVPLETSGGKLGFGMDEVDESQRVTRLMPREYAKGHYLVIKVYGDSMDDGTKKAIAEGDEVLVRKWEEQIEYIPLRRKLFVITTERGSVIKQITEVNMKKQYIKCHSFNPDYEDYKIPFEQIYQPFTVEKIVNSKIVF